MSLATSGSSSGAISIRASRPARSRPPLFSTMATTLHVWFSGLISGSTYSIRPEKTRSSIDSSAPEISGVTRTP